MATTKTIDLSYISAKLSRDLNISEYNVKATLKLLEEGATVPFIARYRKEQTGSLDEVQIAAIRDGSEKIQELEKRRAFIVGSIDSQGLLNQQLFEKIKAATSLNQLEDLYLPYKPKRRTRATIAKEKGLEGLAKAIMSQNHSEPNSIAKKYINPSKGVEKIEDALAGASDIIAEWVNEHAGARERLRNLFEQKSELQSKLVKGKEEEAAKYRDYFDSKESIRRMPSHRILAIFRATKEGFIRFKIQPDEEQALRILDRIFIKSNNDCTTVIEDAISDSYKRLLQPSLETEMKQLLKEKADSDAINVFCENIRELLLAAPLGEKRILALDPGYRTGCKLVCLNKQGKLIHNSTIYPHASTGYKKEEAGHEIKQLTKKHQIEAIAIGNGTAGRETFQFIQELQLESNIQIVMVNESGASIYSASETAREEFPDQDITVRGAVSIGRRLMDPLSELVKIDPKSIGVGQYQHDVNQTALQKGLDDVVINSVNAVGVEVNTASKNLLTYVSGLGPKLAENIVHYRNDNGTFETRAQLKKVKGLGAKAYEQAAGFLRIRQAKNPLDSSAVHPERYNLVKQMAKDLNCGVKDLMSDSNLRKQVKIKDYISNDVGLPTLKDILSELEKPGRDPRENFESFEFSNEVKTIDDLKVDMELPGIITNVTDFGAFVDIGIKENGMVHKSQLADRFVADPKTVVKVNQKVKVKVLQIDKERKRVGLTMKGF